VKTLNQKINQNGAAAVEFAIVLPLLVTLVFGIIEFSILFYNKAMLTNASREGARAGIVLVPDQTYDDVEGIVRGVVTAYCGSYLITFGNGGANPTVLVNPTGSGEPVAGDPLRVTVKYHYDFLVLPNFITTLMGGLDLSAVTVMRME
jgi:Flp pilus assembly protein TadG